MSEAKGRARPVARKRQLAYKKVSRRVWRSNKLIYLLRQKIDELTKAGFCLNFSFRSLEGSLGKPVPHKALDLARRMLRHPALGALKLEEP